MFKYLEEQRLNFLLKALAETAEHIGLQRLEPAETAVLELLYEQRATTEEFFERAERFHMELKRRYGLYHQPRTSVEGLSMVYHSAQVTSRPITSKPSQPSPSSRNHGNYTQWVVRSPKVPVAGGGGLHSCKTSDEKLQLIEKMLMEERSPSQNRTFFLTGNVKTIHQSRPKSAKWDSFIASKKQHSYAFRKSEKNTTSTYFATSAKLTVCDTSNRPSQHRAKSILHKSIERSAVVSQKKQRLKLKKKPSKQSRPHSKGARHKESKQNIASLDVLASDLSQRLDDQSTRKAVQHSKIKQKWRQVVKDAVHQSRQKIIDIAFWMKPADKFQAESETREELTNLHYYRQQRQSVKDLHPALVSVRLLPQDSMSTIAVERHSDSLLQITP